MKIKAINEISYKGNVHNIAVMGDETYFANKILVHNCRSILVAILIGESELAGYYSDYENTFPTWGEGVPPDATRPAPGFGG